jgi:hypothetical protein
VAKKYSMRTQALLFALSLALAGCGARLFPDLKPSATPGAEEARKAWRAVAGPSPTPRPEIKPPKVNLDFLKAFFEFIAKNKTALSIIAFLFLAGICLWLFMTARRRAARGLPALFARIPKRAAPEPEDIKDDDQALAAELYASALRAAEAGDFSKASILLRRARVAELVEAGSLPAHREFGDREIAKAIGRAGASDGAYRILSRAADSVLFGDRTIGANEWIALLEAFANSKAAPR